MMKHKQILLFAMLVLFAAVFLYGFHIAAEHKVNVWVHDMEVKSAVTKADMVAEFLDELGVELTPENLSPIIAKVGDSPDFRITVLDLTGAVLADSWLSAGEVKALKNYATRPEVSQANLHEPGVAFRFSETVGNELMYVTHRYQRDHFAGYIRIATPASIGTKK